MPSLRQIITEELGLDTPEWLDDLMDEMEEEFPNIEIADITSEPIELSDGSDEIYIFKNEDSRKSYLWDFCQNFIDEYGIIDVFRNNFSESFLTVREADIEIGEREYWDQMNRDEQIYQFDHHDDVKDLLTQIEELENIEDGLSDEQIVNLNELNNKLDSLLVDYVEEVVADRVEEITNDPVEYYKSNYGYTIKQMIEYNLIFIDEIALIKHWIDSDGFEEILGYDKLNYDLPDEMSIYLRL